MAALTWMSNGALTRLNESVEDNVERYRYSDFYDLIDSSWNQRNILDYDPARLALLSGDSKDELHDSILFFDIFKRLPPRLAACLNVWVPLIHTDLLQFARQRWIKTGFDDALLVKTVRGHIFRSGVGGCRDDNVAGRLWWTGYIGSQMAGTSDPDLIKEVLRPFTRTTDYRLTVIERSGLFSESRFASAISRYLSDGRFPEHGDQSKFREFIVSVNLKSNGRYFGDMTMQEVFDFLDECH